MTQQTATFNTDQRRSAGIRRTVLITGALALTFFVLFFVVQLMQH